MNKKKYVSVLVILASTFLLFSCGKGKVTYKEGFPTEDSPALMEFMRDEILRNTGRLLFRDDNNNIYVEKKPNSELGTLKYFTYTEESLKRQYEPILQAEDVPSLFRNLRLGPEAEKELQQPIKDETKYPLPTISMKKDNQLEIQTLENEKLFDLPVLLADYGVEKSDEITFNLIAVNDEYIHIELQDTDIGNPANQSISLFINQELSDVVSTKRNAKDFEETYSSGKLDKYEDLFKEIDPQGRYLYEPGVKRIIDSEKRKIRFVEDADYLSKDGKYVYLNGAEKEISDGKQKIQKINNYMEGNDIYESEFKISFKKIAKEAGIKMHGISIAKVVYFNEDYVVLSLNYKGFIVGEAGFTNVIIDLQEDKNNPPAYIVDLDIIL